jgi:hypothetical protein
VRWQPYNDFRLLTTNSKFVQRDQNDSAFYLVCEPFEVLGLSPRICFGRSHKTSNSTDDLLSGEDTTDMMLIKASPVSLGILSVPYIHTPKSFAPRKSAGGYSLWDSGRTETIPHATAGTDAKKLLGSFTRSYWSNAWQRTAKRLGQLLLQLALPTSTRTRLSRGPGAGVSSY